MNTTTSRLTVALFIASLLLSTNKAEAQTFVFSPVMDACIASKIKRYSDLEYVLSARQIVTACACIENRMKQGMRVEDCPITNLVTREQMSKVFSGEW